MSLLTALLVAVVAAEPQSWGYSYQQVPYSHHSFYQQQPHHSAPLRSFYPGKFQTPYTVYSGYYPNSYYSPYFPSPAAGGAYGSPFGVKNVNAPADTFYSQLHDEKVISYLNQIEQENVVIVKIIGIEFRMARCWWTRIGRCSQFSFEHKLQEPTAETCCYRVVCRTTGCGDG